MIMATSKRTHVFEGEIDAQKIYDQFVAEDKYLDFPVLGGKGHSTQMIFVLTL